MKDLVKTRIVKDFRKEFREALSYDAKQVNFTRPLELSDFSRLLSESVDESVSLGALKLRTLVVDLSSGNQIYFGIFHNLGKNYDELKEIVLNSHKKGNVSLTTEETREVMRRVENNLMIAFLRLDSDAMRFKDFESYEGKMLFGIITEKLGSIGVLKRDF